MTYKQLHRGVPIPEEFVDVPEISEAAEWRRGVNDALKVLRLEEAAAPGDDPKEIFLSAETQALVFMLKDEPEKADKVIRRMTGRERAALKYIFGEMRHMMLRADALARQALWEEKDL